MFAVWAAKLTEKVCVHVFRRQGVTWAGRIALLICPSILRELAGEVRERIFVICGTNGKTTVNNLLCAALEAEGYGVLCNRTGSNMLNGVAAAFALGAKMSGKIDVDHACIEIDEASAREVLAHFKPDYMVLTNLFRDQLDRYGEIDSAMDILGRAMRSSPGMELIVNGDDPLSVFLAMDSGNDFKAYGIGEHVAEDDETKEIREGRFCRRCGAPLSYRFYHYGQLGDYTCPKCGFQRPGIQFEGKDVEIGEEIGFSVDGRRFRSAHKGFYNLYNILAVYAAVRTAGTGTEHFQEMLTGFRPENGRMEEFRSGDMRIILNLAKNPTGFNQNINVIMQDPLPKELVVAINDNDQDGADISWLWDVDFERLEGMGPGRVTASGIRCRDLMLRLKYAGISARFEPNVEKAVRRYIEKGGGNLYVIVNYTALFGTRNMLKRICAHHPVRKQTHESQSLGG